MDRLCFPLLFLLKAFAGAENAKSDSTFQYVEQPVINAVADFTPGTISLGRAFYRLRLLP